MQKDLIRISNIEIPMRDGVILRADNVRPKEEGPLPAILLRTPYSKDRMAMHPGLFDPEFFASCGYNVIFQDCRGFFLSDGIPSVSGENDAEDGYDTIEWIAAQDWCDGHVGTFGLSFFGFVQLCAASLNPPHLTCMCPFECCSDHPVTMNRNGSYSPYHLTWLYNSALPQVDKLDTTEEEKARIRAEIEKNRPTIMEQVLKTQPMSAMPAINIKGFDYFDEYMESVEHNNDPAYWALTGIPFDLDAMNVPTMMLTGWYDHAGADEMVNYKKVRDGNNRMMKENLRLIIGPWAHGEAMSNVVDGIDYGEQSSAENAGTRFLLLNWFDYWMKGKKEGLMRDAKVNYYTMIEGRWKTSKIWPPEGSIGTPFYLVSAGNARSSEGNGLLSLSEDSEAPEDTYLHDPEDPLPSEGPGLSKRNGDFSEAQKRQDIVCYSTEVLKEDMEITGSVSLKLYASVEAEDGDFYCRLTDVDPEGHAIRLTWGMVRISHYDSWSESHFTKPGEIRAYDVDMGDLSYLMKAGHRLRLDIAGSAYPFADPNLGTTDKIGHGTKAVKALHHILHREGFRSVLILPLMKH